MIIAKETLQEEVQKILDDRHLPYKASNMVLTQSMSKGNLISVCIPTKGEFSKHPLVIPISEILQSIPKSELVFVKVKGVKSFKVFGEKLVSENESSSEALKFLRLEHPNHDISLSSVIGPETELLGFNYTAITNSGEIKSGMLEAALLYGNTKVKLKQETDYDV